MKTIELGSSKAKKNGKVVQRPVVLTIGNRPVAAFVPTMHELTPFAAFDHIIEEEERITLTLNGQPIAILETLAPLVLFDEQTIDLETLAMSTDPEFLVLIDQSRQHHETKGGISSADMRQRLGVR